MNFRRIATAFFAIALLATQSSCGSQSAAAEVYTYNCDSSEIKPVEIVLTCADAGMYIDHIKWDSWSANGATGTALYNANDCDPYCAAGKMVTKKVQVILNQKYTYKGKQYLRNLVITSTDGSDLPGLTSSTYTHDVMEYILGMDG